MASSPDADPDNVYHRALLEDKVRVPPSQLGQDLAVYLLSVLRTRYCGVCSKYGFVQDVSIVSVADPVMRLFSLNGDATCRVVFEARLCNPHVGAIVRGAVVSSNKFGVLVRCGPLDCVIARSPVSVRLRSHVDVDSVSPGNVVHVRVLGRRFEVGDVVISVVGKLVTHEEFEEALQRSQMPVQAKEPAARRQSATLVREVRVPLDDSDGLPPGLTVVRQGAGDGEDDGELPVDDVEDEQSGCDDAEDDNTVGEEGFEDPEDEEDLDEDSPSDPIGDAESDGDGDD